MGWVLGDVPRLADKLASHLKIAQSAARAKSVRIIVSI
jgi:hypothetical protein